MKKHIFLTLLFCLVPCLLQAQVKSFTFEIPGAGFNYDDGGIIRSVGNDSLVVFYKNPTPAQYISTIKVVGFTSGMLPVPNGNKNAIDNNISINDIRVLDDYAFFCGYTQTPNVGVFGWCNLQTGVYEYTSVASTSTLKKLAVNKVNGNYHLVAIGNLPSMQNCIVESADVMYGSTVSICLMPYVSSSQAEVLDDVFFTDNYSVFVGRDTRWGDNCISIRMSTLSYATTNTALCNKYMFYSDNSLLGATHSVCMDSNRFALTYVDNALRMDMHRVSVAGGTPSIAVSQRENAYVENEMKDVAYLAESRQVLVLWRQTGNKVCHMVLLDPFKTVPYSFPDPWWADRVATAATHLGGHCFAIWGANGCALQNTQTYLGPASPYSCLRTAENNAIIIPTPEIIESVECVATSVLGVSHTPEIPFHAPFPPTTKCIKYE